MKKIVLGGMMMIAGIISVTIIMTGTMATTIDFLHNGSRSFFWNLNQFQLTAPFVFFIIIAVIGLALSIWGLFEKQDK
jgi:hypothetical protein